MPISFGDEHAGVRAGDWCLGGPTDQLNRNSFVTASMQAPSSAPADTESVLPTMQALPSQPGARLLCSAHPNIQ